MVARLAQSVEHETLNLRVVGSSPTLGVSNSWIIYYQKYISVTITLALKVFFFCIENLPLKWNKNASREDWTLDPWFTRPVLYHWAKGAVVLCISGNFLKWRAPKLPHKTVQSLALHASREDWTLDPWFTRPVLCHWAIEAICDRCQTLLRYWMTAREPLLPLQHLLAIVALTV